MSPYFSATSKKGTGRDDLSVAAHHPEQELFAARTAGERHDGLRVQDEAVLVEGFADSPDPRERGELALDAEPFGAFFGDVAKHDHCARADGAAEDRRRRIRRRG